MEEKQDRPWCSMTPLYCSIMPIGLAAAFIILIYVADPDAFRPWSRSCFEGLAYGLVLYGLVSCFGLLIALLMVPVGIYSVLSGIDAIREPEARGKPMVAIAIAIAVFDIMAGAGCLLWIFSKVF